MKKCPNCARAYSDMVTVCPACKTSLSGGAAAPRPAPQATRPTPPPVQQQTPPAQPYTPPQPQRPAAPTYTPPQQTTGTYTPVSQQPVTHSSNPVPRSSYTSYHDDKAGLVWIILSFLLPIVGIVLNYRWKHDRPKAAKAVSAAAIAGLLIGIFMSTMSGNLGDLIPEKKITLAQGNPEAYRKVFSDRYLVETPVSFRDLDSASYVIADASGALENVHYGYDGDTVAAMVQTLYFPLPAGASTDKGYYDEYIRSTMPAFNHLSFVTFSSNISQSYYSMTLTITGLDNTTNFKQAVSSGIVVVTDSNASSLSMTASEQALLANGYIKK